MLRLLAIFTIGVPQTESAIPMAHWLPLVLSSLLCLGGSLLYASDWSTDYPLNSLSFLALFLLQFGTENHPCHPWIRFVDQISNRRMI